MFNLDDYRRAAKALNCPISHVQAVVHVEAAGETFWELEGARVPPLRPEAHWFGKLTGHRFDASHPSISCRRWTPALAARSRAEAWAQYQLMKSLDPKAAIEATSWGPFQIMGFHWRALGFASPEAFLDAQDGPDDDAQMDTFVRLVKSDLFMWDALRRGDWEAWETSYNGGGYGGAYAAKIRAALPLFEGEQVGTVPRLLHIGMFGSDVAELQRALGMKVADGHFGPATQAAVKSFQSAHGLVVDGRVGTLTRRAIWR